MICRNIGKTFYKFVINIPLSVRLYDIEFLFHLGLVREIDYCGINSRRSIVYIQTVLRVLHRISAFHVCNFPKLRRSFLIIAPSRSFITICREIYIVVIIIKHIIFGTYAIISVGNSIYRFLESLAQSNKVLRCRFYFFVRSFHAVCKLTCHADCIIKLVNLFLGMRFAYFRSYFRTVCQVFIFRKSNNKIVATLRSFGFRKLFVRYRHNSPRTFAANTLICPVCNRT